MVSRDTKATILLLVGIGLLLNPVYFSPHSLDGVGTEITYEVAPIENETIAGSVVRFSDQTLRCGNERSCVLEEKIMAEGDVKYNGTIEIESEDQLGYYSNSWRKYSIVSFDGDFYLPREEITNQETVLTHEQVTTAEALNHTSISSNQTSVEVKEAVDTGSITLIDKTIPEFERQVPIEHEGEVYYVSQVSHRGSPHQHIIPIRLTLFLLGFCAIVIAWQWRGQ
ncbi:hypothetical protein [Natrarchaeobius halalkaliphilus]|uniref:hypothetical protein n=1 Tax=Natrarchaeobius halalkaliphilus TaxID=1679091 RepID=UPI000F51B599|nr:hypothetical protein [Natrarchaeobius halalkaliphilus]